MLHTHHVHDELYLVLQGQYRFKIDGEEHEGGPGMFVYAPRGMRPRHAARSSILVSDAIRRRTGMSSRIPGRITTRELSASGEWPH